MGLLVLLPFRRVEDEWKGESSRETRTEEAEETKSCSEKERLLCLLVTYSFLLASINLMLPMIHPPPSSHAPFSVPCSNSSSHCVCLYV